MVEQGELAEGIDEMRRGLDACSSAGVEIWQPFLLCLLTEAYQKARQLGQGLAAVADAEALAEKNEEHIWIPELYRLKGELLLAEGAAASEVELCFERAIEIARSQKAKSLELRAAMSLARLWQAQGIAAAAYEMLASIYGWFTEGFDTSDLKEAKTLLAELASRSDR